MLYRTSVKLRFDRGLHGLQPDDDLHSENGRRDIVIENHLRQWAYVQELQLGQRLALQRQAGLPAYPSGRGRREERSFCCNKRH